MKVIGVSESAVACGVFAYAAFLAAHRKHKFLPWVFSLLALLFNPIVEVHLPKELWVLVDVVAGVVLLATTKKFGTDA